MSRTIPLVDLGAVHAPIRAELDAAIAGVIDRGAFVLGPEVAAFEREVADWLGVEHAVGVSCGSDALVIALRALGIGPGDEVVTTALSFVATVEAIVRVGATPVFADVDPVHLGLDPTSVASVLSANTRAVLVVHLFGDAADLDGLRAVLPDDVFLVEDAAQAFGGRVDGRALGTLATAGAYSFFPTKNLGALGDGGLLVTNDGALAREARALRQHGFVPGARGLDKSTATRLGYNARLDALQAAVLRVKLRHLEAANQSRRALAARYDDALGALPDIEPAGWPRRPSVDHAFQLYCVRLADPARRAALQSRLGDAGIATRIYYERALHEMPPYREARRAALRETERACAELLALPLWPWMPTQTQARVIEAVAAALAA